MADGAPFVQHPWRCFVAVPSGDALRAAVSGCVAALRAHPTSGDWRWTDAEGWHVTLAFLGATDPGAVAGLSAALDAVAAAHEPFELEAGGLGAFPSRGRARVLWYGIADPDGRLHRLARSVRAAVGLPDDERFRGHLTLARARDRFGTDAGAMLGSVTASGAALTVDRLALFRSHLGRGPAHYEELSTATLRGGIG